MITAQVFGTERVMAKFRSMHPRIQRDLARVVRSLAIELTAHVKQNKLTGQVLKVQTGTLRRSINYRVKEEPQNVQGSVGTNVIYARAHEYGFTGTVNVRAHLRIAKQVFGRAVEPTTQHVGAHARRMHLPQRSFLRSALADMKPEMLVRMEAAAKQTAQAVMK